MEWEKEGVNYWENPECPIEYLQKALVQLINDVEGGNLSDDFFKNSSRERLVEGIQFYEYVSDK